MGAIHRFTGSAGRFRWEHVPVEGYADPAVTSVTKQVMIGPREGAENYSMRYFEIAPGGKSSFDQHEHDHGVMVLSGCGRVLLGAEQHEIGFGDVIYIAPNEIHQFENTGTEPLGFVCVAPPKR
jgi:quercetin dioxygenase-like cupin family protein